MLSAYELQTARCKCLAAMYALLTCRPGATSSKVSNLVLLLLVPLALPLTCSIVTILAVRRLQRSWHCRRAGADATPSSITWRSGDMQFSCRLEVRDNPTFCPAANVMLRSGFMC